MTQSMGLRKATRQKAKVRIGLSGPSGSGKTYSAIMMASGMVPLDKVAVIDTENGSADLYSHLGDYSVITLPAPYSPERYIQALDECQKAGMEVIIIDSVTHEWDGKGGCLESNDILARSKYKGNSWSAWNETTPRHQRFIEAITSSPCHIITTARSKTDTIQTEDKKIKKVGLKEIQREGYEYELTANFTIDRDGHYAMASKDRTGMFSERDPFIIGPEIGKEIMDWALSGVEPLPPPPKPQPERVGAGMPSSAAAEPKDHTTMTVIDFLEIINERQTSEKTLLSTYAAAKTRDDISMEDRGILSGNFLRHLCEKRNMRITGDFDSLTNIKGEIVASLTWTNGWVSIGKPKDTPPQSPPPPSAPSAPTGDSPRATGVQAGDKPVTTGGTTGAPTGTDNPVLVTKKKIEALLEEIAYEQAMYDAGCEHPTDTDQFWRGHQAQGARIQKMRLELEEMKKTLPPEEVVSVVPHVPTFDTSNIAPMTEDQWMLIQKLAQETGHTPVDIDQYAKQYFDTRRPNVPMN